MKDGKQNKINELEKLLKESRGREVDLRAKLSNADKEERRLSESNCNFQLQIYNLEIEHRALFQSLYDCQALRKKFQDEVSRLKISLAAK